MAVGLAYHRVSVAQWQSILARNAKVWGSILREDWKFFLCPTFVTTWKKYHSLFIHPNRGKRWTTSHSNEVCFNFRDYHKKLPTVPPTNCGSDWWDYYSVFVFNSTWKFFWKSHLEFLFRFFWLWFFVRDCSFSFVCLFFVKRKLTMKVSWKVANRSTIKLIIWERLNKVILKSLMILLEESRKWNSSGSWPLEVL